MKMSGLNTYDPVQIEEDESKFNLNCYNKNGELVGYDYSTEFVIPNVRVYQREYWSNTYTNVGANSVVSGSPRFLHENDTTVYPSGIVKPNCSVYVDTTKFDTAGNSNYCRKAGEFNLDYAMNSSVGVKRPIIADELYNAIVNFGTECEVYRDVEVAVSYSGPYGESGLTKFRFSSNILHFFVIVHGVDKYRSNPNYRYLNVYVRYGSYTELQLLHRIKITELLDTRNKSLNITTDESDSVFYTTYDKDDLYYLTNETWQKVRYYNSASAMLDSGSTTSSIIYSGLFQFEDESLINASWFVSQKVTAIAPNVDVETHTYISSEEYTFQNNINEYLDDKFKLNDSITTNANDTPLITNDFMIESLIENDELDPFSLTVCENIAKLSKRSWPTPEGGVISFSKRNIHNDMSTNADIYGQTMGWVSSDQQGSNYRPDTYDMYNGDYEFSKEPGKLNQRDTGEFIIQYWLDDDGDRILINTSLVTFIEYKYFTLHFDNIVTDCIDNSKKWQLDIWAKSNDVGELYYRIMSIDVTEAYNLFIASAGTAYSIENAEYLINTSIRYSYCNIGLSGGVNGNRKFPLRDFGCTYNEDTETLGMFIVMNFGTIVDKVGDYKVGLYGGDGDDYALISDDVNFFEDIEDLLYNPDGRFEDAYSSYKDGVRNSPRQDKPNWNIDIRHMEEYDGRLWYVSKERTRDIIADLDVDGILDRNPTEDDGLSTRWIVSKSDVADEIYYVDEYGDVAIVPGVSEEDVLVYNKEDSTYYKYTVDPVLLNRYVEYYQYSADYKDLYYSQQGYPEMILETNYKGYNDVIVGIREFISQLYVFCENEINVIRKSLTREVSGIIEPTYQYDKVFDKGCIEWTIAEYEKKVFFTNSDGIFYIDAGGNINSISDKINKLFTDGYITEDSVDYGTIKDEFYILTLSKIIPFSVFSELELTYPEYRLLYAQHIAFHIPTNTFWLGNDASSGTFWIYMSKDFSQRNKYENEFLMKQNKRISIAFRDGDIKLVQIRNRLQKLGEVQLSPAPYNQPLRQTLSGNRCSTYGMMFSGQIDTKMRDFYLLENGK